MRVLFFGYFGGISYLYLLSSPYSTLISSKFPPTLSRRERGKGAKASIVDFLLIRVVRFLGGKSSICHQNVQKSSKPAIQQQQTQQ